MDRFDPIVRLGEWLFRHRTSIPVPLALAILLVPADRLEHPLMFDGAGIGLVAFGELLRLWAVRHIGVISRTRSDRLGPLITGGPFAYIRNPLYIGNLALWVGFALAAHVPWIALLVAILLALEYHAIVRWEEGLLLARRGDEYRAYMARVPRWLPRLSGSDPGPTPAVRPEAVFTWRDTLYSERGTLIGIALGVMALLVKVKT